MRSRGGGLCEDKSRGTQARVALPPHSERDLERARQVQARAVTKAESGEVEESLQVAWLRGQTQP